MGEASSVLTNIAIASYEVGNGQFMLGIAEQRLVSGVDLPPNLPEDAREIIFEHGRFALTPRAARQLLDTLVAAVRAYEDTVGSPLPTIDQFVARAAMTTLGGPTRSPST
jgi:hypothetical protein